MATARRRGRFRPTDAFVDESVRGRRYLMGCVLIEARDLHTTRAAMEQLATGVAPRIHFNNDSAQQKRRVLDAIAEMPLEVFVAVCTTNHRTNEFEARAACVTEIILELQRRSVGKLVIESRHDDRDDVRVITRARWPKPMLVFEHRVASRERMLWIADAVTWAIGAGPTWRDRLGGVVTRVVEVQP